MILWYVSMSAPRMNQKSIPMYLVSPQLLVTNEHIISESSSTSSCGLSGSTVLCLLFSFLLCGSGDVNWLRGVDIYPSFGVLWDGEVGSEPRAWEGLRELLFSAKRFSNVPRSVRPLSSSARSPAKR